MNNMSKLGRPARLGLISAGMPAGFDEHVRRSLLLTPTKKAAPDVDATAAISAVDARTQRWIMFNVCVGTGLLSGEQYFHATRWLLDAGVDSILCISPLEDQQMYIIGANQHARRLGIPLFVADSADHVDREAWAQDVVLASAGPTLSSDEAVWSTEPERCRIGGRSRTHASAAGVVAGVALSALERALPRTELMDSLRAWTLLPERRLAS